MSSGSFHFQMDGMLHIGGFPLEFGIDFAGENGGLALFARWSNNGNGCADIQKIAALADMEVPDGAFGFPLPIREFDVAYRIRDHALAARLDVDAIGSLEAKAALAEKSLSLALHPALKANLTLLPLVGGALQAGDSAEVASFEVAITPALVETAVHLRLVIAGTRLDIPVSFSFPRSRKSAYSDPADRNAPAPTPPKVFWAQVGKTLGFLNIYRVGVSFADGCIALYLDAGFHIAMLTAVFYDMCLRIPLAAGKSVSFSLDGVALSLDKPPLALSGGLYRDAASGMYNGELVVGFGKFRLTALGSYGALKMGNREIQSLFAYLVVSVPLGGSPMLFVTGLAAGFGVNRHLSLPERPENVADFPFVAAAMGRPGIAGVRTPAEMLKELGTLVQPKEDATFVTAGVKFLSFGMLESFVLLSVEFGKDFCVSVLGLSVLSIPAKATTPVAYACLAVKASYSTADGIISVLACLTNDSFVFDRNCKLTGGAALVVWTKGEHAGDFVVTLGGYHPLYDRKHYPLVNPVGASWKISDTLSLSASAYFALTPNAVMAGGRLSITYQSGKLKAWFIAWADFLMQWKPFRYDINIGISIGASYRVDFLFIHHTFTIELGAQLHLWGPKFAGTARITWFIISFTISFGENGAAPPPLTWAAFRDEFLPKPADSARARGENAAGDGRLCSITLIAGLAASAENGALPLVEPDFLVIEASSLLPSGTITVAGGNGDAVFQSAPALRIAPMGGISFTAALRVSLSRRDGSPVALSSAPVRGNAPGALWGNADRNLLDNSMIADVATGVTLRPVRKSPVGLRPARGAYSLAVLAANQPVQRRRPAWVKPAYPANRASSTDPLGDLQRSIASPPVSAARRRVASQLIPFGVTADGIDVGAWGRERFLFAPPRFATTGHR